MNSVTAIKPSPAIVVAALALVAALAGTAVAGPDASTSAINKKKVKQIATKQIDKRFPVGTEDIAEGAVTSPKLADGAISTVMRQGPTETVPINSFKRAEASCLPGERATGGGVFNESNVFTLKVTSSYPTPNPQTPPPTGDGRVPTGWRVWTANNGTESEVVNAYVVCSSG
ncbi:MAG: hypothetical protein ACRDL1_06595 [Solirubrobacterales bacterium]